MHLKALWLLNVHLLLYEAIEKCGLHIHLVDLPTHLCCYRYNGADRSISSHGSEGLLIINSLYLGEPSSHKPRFEFLNAAICSMLYLVKPSGSNHGFALRPRHHLPNIILHDRRILLLHGLSPDLLASCLLIARRLRVKDAGNHRHITTKPLRWSTLSDRPLRLSNRCGISQGVLKPLGLPLP